MGQQIPDPHEIRCLECGHVQDDRGPEASCEECHAPMPTKGQANAGRIIRKDGTPHAD